MTHYNINSLKSAVYSVRTPKTCTKYSRCNKWKICPKCNLIREKKIKKSLEFLRDSEINEYKHKKYIVIKSLDIDIPLEIKNKKIDDFRKAFLSKKINKNFAINKDSEYFITKEISWNDKFRFNPHLNIILLQNEEFNPKNKQLLKLLKEFNLDIYVKDIYKVNDNYKNSILNIISYSIKFDKERASIEQTMKVTHNKRDLFKSSFFKKKKSLVYLHKLIFIKNIFKTKNKENSHSYLCIYIRALKEKTKKDLYKAKQIFKRNAQKKHIKNYLRLLKSLRKKKKIIIERERRKIKRAQTRFRANFY